MKGLLLLLAATILNGGEMIQVRKSEERGHGEHGWLTANYTFSFAGYHDENFMGFRNLRVINEDTVAPKKGFDTHPHDNMEILTYILEGTIEHKDSLGNTVQIKKGEFQLQTAGTGIEHSEYNPSKKDPVHLLQIWIEPYKRGLAPAYHQKSFADHKNGLKLAVSPDGKEGSLKINQDAKIYLGRFEEAGDVEFSLAEGRHVWIQVTEGEIDLNGIALGQGDGASVSEESSLDIASKGGKSEFLLFDLK